MSHLFGEGRSEIPGVSMLSGSPYLKTSKKHPLEIPGLGFFPGALASVQESGRICSAGTQWETSAPGGVRFFFFGGWFYWWVKSEDF